MAKKPRSRTNNSSPSRSRKVNRLETMPKRLASPIRYDGPVSRLRPSYKPLVSPRHARNRLVAILALNAAMSDDRTWHPDRRRPLRTVSGTRILPLSPSPMARAKLAGSRQNTTSNATRDMAGLSPFLSFRAPKKVVLCVRRKQRREVMFAVGGAGTRKMRRPTRTFWSEVRC